METSGPAVLIVFLYSALAAALAALGTLPFLGRERITRRGVGWAYALAAGLMPGAAYILMTEDL